MATHSSILAWRIPCTEERGGLQSRKSQRIRHDLATEHAHTNHVTIIMSLIPFNLPPSASSESVVFEEHHMKTFL